MRRQWTGLVLLTAALLVFAGCKKEPYLRPPKPPEQLVAPPVEEARGFSRSRRTIPRTS